MKKWIMVFLLCMFAVSAFALEITLTIDDAKLSRVTDAMKGLFGPVPTDAEGNPTMSDNAFAKEVMRLWVCNQVRRFEASQAAKSAASAIVVDNEIIN